MNQGWWVSTERQDHPHRTVVGSKVSRVSLVWVFIMSTPSYGRDTWESDAGFKTSATLCRLAIPVW